MRHPHDSAHLCLRGQCYHLAQRGPHLLWSALEQASTAHREERVTCEVGIRDDEGN